MADNLTEDDYTTTPPMEEESDYLFILAAPPLFVVGLLGNIIVISVLSRNKKPFVSFTYFFIAMTVTDSVQLLVGLLTQWIRNVHSVKFSGGAIIVCRLTSWFAHSSLIASSWFLVAMAAERTLDRYLTFDRVVSRLFTKQGIIWIVVGSLMVDFQEITSYIGVRCSLGDYVGPSRVLLAHAHGAWRLLSAMFLVPFVIDVFFIVLLLSRLIRLIKKKRQKSSTNRRFSSSSALMLLGRRRTSRRMSEKRRALYLARKSMIVTLVLLSLTYAVFLSPAVFLEILRLNFIFPDGVNSQVRSILILLVNAHASSKLFLLYFTSAEFRRQLLAFFFYLYHCCRRSEVTVQATSKSLFLASLGGRPPRFKAERRRAESSDPANPVKKQRMNKRLSRGERGTSSVSYNPLNIPLNDLSPGSCLSTPERSFSHKPENSGSEVSVVNEVSINRRLSRSRKKRRNYSRLSPRLLNEKGKAAEKWVKLLSGYSSVRSRVSASATVQRSMDTDSSRVVRGCVSASDITVGNPNQHP